MKFLFLDLVDFVFVPVSNLLRQSIKPEGRIIYDTLNQLILHQTFDYIPHSVGHTTYLATLTYNPTEQSYKAVSCRTFALSNLWSFCATSKFINVKMHFMRSVYIYWKVLANVVWCCRCRLAEHLQVMVEEAHPYI